MPIDLVKIQIALDRAAYKAVHGTRQERAGRFYLMDDNPNIDFHEVWWIYAPERHPWGGARIAHFRKTIDGTLIAFIQGEPKDRTGPRIWSEIVPREGWVKVRPIPFPTRAEIDAAVDDAMREIVEKIKAEHGFEI